MKIYAVMEMCGNFSHTLEEFDNRDSASEFVMDHAITDAMESMKIENRLDIDEVEFEEELELALSYYSIDKWEVA